MTGEVFKFKTITRERLIQAITANNPADVAINNVIVAANRSLKFMEEGRTSTEFFCLQVRKKGRALKPGGPYNCLLAHAWRKPFKQISVSTGGYTVFNNRGVKEVEDHPFEDVVRWFDQFDTRVACEKVLALLRGDKQEA